MACLQHQNVYLMGIASSPNSNSHFTNSSLITSGAANTATTGKWPDTTRPVTLFINTGSGLGGFPPALNARPFAISVGSGPESVVVVIVVTGGEVTVTVAAAATHEAGQARIFSILCMCRVRLRRTDSWSWHASWCGPIVGCEDEGERL
jgi:hypothetical protein